MVKAIDLTKVADCDRIKPLADINFIIYYYYTFEVIY